MQVQRQSPSGPGQYSYVRFDADFGTINAGTTTTVLASAQTGDNTPDASVLINPFDNIDDDIMMSSARVAGQDQIEVSLMNFSAGNVIVGSKVFNALIVRNRAEPRKAYSASPSGRQRSYKFDVTGTWVNIFAEMKVHVSLGPAQGVLHAQTNEIVMVRPRTVLPDGVTIGAVRCTGTLNNPLMTIGLVNLTAVDVENLTHTFEVEVFTYCIEDKLTSIIPP